MASRRLRQTVESLADPAFRNWFLSQILSASGTMAQGVALSWLVLKMTGSGVDLGLMTTFSFLPVTVTGSWAGALVDRVDRRRLLIATQILFIVLSASLGALMADGAVRLSMVFAFAVAFGLVNAADAPARQVYVLELVGANRVANAVSLNEVVLNASRVLGPAFGGVLLVTAGVSACFFFNAATFLPPLVVLLMCRSTASVTPEAVRTARPGQVRAGLRCAWGSPAIRICLIMAAASGMLFSLGASLPLLATQVLRLGGGGYGAVNGDLRGGGGPGCALVQIRAAPSMRGRVMGIWTMALPGATPLTSPLVGWVAGSIGPREGFGLAGIALLATVGAGWRRLSGTDTPRFQESDGELVPLESSAERDSAATHGYQHPRQMRTK
jgi:predicted MFS family arabinose efflux permease